MTRQQATRSQVRRRTYLELHVVLVLIFAVNFRDLLVPRAAVEYVVRDEGAVRLLGRQVGAQEAGRVAGPVPPLMGAFVNVAVALVAVHPVAGAEALAVLGGGKPAGACGRRQGTGWREAAWHS